MEEVKSGWYWDRIFSQRQSEVEEACRKQQKDNKKLIKQIGKVSRGLNDQKILQEIGWTKEELEGIIKEARSELKKDNTQFAIQKREDFEKGHPILLGPATLDGLLEHVPDRLDYIKEGKFPFDNVFFEFMEPVKEFNPLDPINIVPLELSLQNRGLELCGIQLIKNRVLSENQEGAYSVLGFHHLVKHNTYLSAEFTVSNNSQSLIGGLIRTPTLENTLVTKFKRSTDSFGNLKELIFGTQIETYPHLSSVGDGEDSMPHSMDEQKIEGYFSKLNNLAINIINYINAQNVTLIPRTRKVQTRKFRESRRSGRGAIHEAEKPFHIVGIDSKTIELEEERDEDKTLQWRVYVRGHNRRIKNERGNIKYLTWVRPHVRGPEDVPWRHHRYADKAAMLEREGKMLGEYLPQLTQT